METVDCIVIGAGVVGLATARALARAGREVVILEAASAIGQGELAVERGDPRRHLLPDRAVEDARLRGRAGHALPLLRGFFRAAPAVRKLIVATSEAERPKLDAIRAQAEANGRQRPAADFRRRGAAIWSRRSRAWRRCSRRRPASSTAMPTWPHCSATPKRMARCWRSTRRCVERTGRSIDGIVVETGGAEPMTLKAKLVVNAAGLGAQAVAASLRGMPAEKIPPQHLAKGNYFSLAGRAPFSRLIYPIPEPGGIGVHLTLDTAGQARFGPDVEWIDALDYSVDPRRGDAFYAVIRRYWPGLEDGALQPAYAGIRPKIERPGGVTTDFMIQTAETHGIPSLVNLFGIESPGLTSSLAHRGRDRRASRLTPAQSKNASTTLRLPSMKASATCCRGAMSASDFPVRRSRQSAGRASDIPAPAPRARRGRRWRAWRRRWKEHLAGLGVGRDVPGLRAGLAPVEDGGDGLAGRRQEGDLGRDRCVAVFGEIEPRRGHEHRRQDVGRDRQRVDAGIEHAETAGAPDPVLVRMPAAHVFLPVDRRRADLRSCEEGSGRLPQPGA